MWDETGNLNYNGRAKYDAWKALKVLVHPPLTYPLSSHKQPSFLRGEASRMPSTTGRIRHRQQAHDAACSHACRSLMSKF